MPPTPIPFYFGFSDALLAEAGGVPLPALHKDVDAILHCCDAVRPLADRLGVPVPKPRLAGFSYNHVSALGAPVIFASGSEPNVAPILHDPCDIDALREPSDYLSEGIVPERLATFDRLQARYPEASPSIGHEYEGPITSAVLLMGPAFFTLPYTDPARAHRLLAFCVKSSLNYTQAIRARLGRPFGNGPAGIADDFAGIFPPPLFEEYVLPAWNALYDGLGATERHLHSELLRAEHLPYLETLGITVFDPSADQYLSPETLRVQCPVPFTGRVQSWDIRDRDASQLQHLYHHIADQGPCRISFYMTFLEDEAKMAALLETARERAAI